MLGRTLATSIARKQVQQSSTQVLGHPVKESKKLNKIQSSCFLHRTFGSTQLSLPNSLAQGLYRLFVALLISFVGLQMVAPQSRNYKATGELGLTEFFVPWTKGTQ